MAFPSRPALTRAELSLPPFVWLLLGCFCLPLAAVVGLSTARSLTLIVIGVGGMAIFALAMLSPQAAIAGLIFVAGFVRIQLSTGTESPLVASLLTAFAISAAWILGMVLSRNLHLVRSPVTFPLIAFVTVNILSLLWGRATLDPRIVMPPTYLRIQTAALMVIVLSATSLLIVGGTVRKRRWIACYISILFAIGVAHAALVFVHGPDYLVTGRGLISMWWVCLAGSQALINTRLKWWARIALGLVSAYWLYELLTVIDWISGWLPAVVTLFVLFLLRSRGTAITTIIITIVIVALFWGHIYKVLYVDQTKEGSIGNDSTGRTALWQRTLSTIAPSPWLGSGPAGYALGVFQFYENGALSAHSNYVDVIAQSGIIGMAFFVWFLGAALVVGWRVQRRLRARGDPFGTAVAVGVFAGVIGVIVAMALGDWFIPFVYNQTIAGFDYTVESWLCIGMLLALDAMSHAPLVEAA